MPCGSLKVYSIHAHKGSHSCLGEVTYTLGANDQGVTGAWESFVPLTPALAVDRIHYNHAVLSNEQSRAAHAYVCQWFKLQILQWSSKG